MSKKSKYLKWYDQPKWAALLAIGGLLAAYGMASRALYTGSLQQYFMTLGLLVAAANRVLHLFMVNFKRRSA